MRRRELPATAEDQNQHHEFLLHIPLIGGLRKSRSMYWRQKKIVLLIL
jgi:hypothetical protein